MANEIYHRSNWGNAVNDIAWGDVYEKFDATNEMFVRSDYYENSNETDKLMAAINPKPSILLTPTAYDNGSLHSVKPVKTFGSELVTNGNFASGTSPFEVYQCNLSNVNNTLVATATSANDSRVRQAITTISGRVYKITADLLSLSGTKVGVTNTNGIAFSYAGSNNERTTSGQFVLFFTAESTTTSIVFKMFDASIGQSFSIDNVSVKEVIDADFDFTRGSSATRVNEQGLIEDVQILSGNLVQNGDFEEIGNDYWTLQSAWTISSGKAIYDNSANNSCSQSFNFQVGKKYQVNFEISDFTTDYRFDVYTGVSFIQSAIITSETSFSILFDGDGGNLLRFRGLARGTGFSLDNVSVKEVTEDTDLPRINYTNGEGSLLLENQSTNTATYSNDFTQGDIFNGSNNPNVLVAVLTSQQAISPDGTNNAWLLKDDSDGAVGQSQININGVNVNSNDFNTISIFVKKALTNDFFALTSQNFDSSANGTTWFNISNGTLGTIDSNHTAKIEDYGNGWYRCQITFKSTTDLIGAIKLRLADTNGNNNVTRNGTNGVYLYGLQCEADATQNYATSYIPTNGSTVTRLADVCNNAGSSDLINSSEGVLYAEISALANDGTNRAIAISDGTTSNVVRFYYSVTDNRIVGNVKSGGTTVFNYNNVLTDATDFLKIAISYKANDFKMYVNGTEVSTDISGNVPTGLTELAFDNGVGNDKFNGNAKTVAVFKEALTDDTELQKLTTI